MSSVTDRIDYSLIAIGTAVGLSDIESLLGIIILIIQVIWFTSKFVYAVYKAIKEKNAEALEKSMDELEANINKTKAEISSKKDED